jgi:hypothetical protein
MRYNPKSYKMLNRDMLKRDLFFFLALVIVYDIYIMVTFNGSEAARIGRLIALIATPLVVIGVVLFFVLTKPKRLIPDAVIDAAEEFQLYIPEDATKRVAEDYAPELFRDRLYVCRRGDAGFEAVSGTLRNLRGARTKIEPDYPRLNIVIKAADGKHVLETFYENVIFGGSIYRVNQKELDAMFFNLPFQRLFRPVIDGK